jgi:hypothetical protein
MSLLVYRILKWTLLTALVLAVVLTVLFSIFVLSPFEGSLGSIEAVVPAGVNLFAAKTVAEGDSAGFFRSDFWRQLTSTRAYQIWVRSPEWRRSGAARGLEQALEQLSVLKDDFRVDPIAEVASREIGTALRLRPQGDPDFLLYLRLTWLARASVAMLENESLRGLMSVPIESAPGSPVLELRMPPGAAVPVLHLTRLKDVLVIGSAPDLVAEARALAAGEGRSFAARAGGLPASPGHPISFRMSPEPGRQSAAWARAVIPRDLDPLSRTFLEAIDPSGLTGLAGRFFLTRSPHLAIDARFHPGSYRPFQAALVTSPVDDLPRTLKPFVDLAPRELMAFVYAHVPPRETARFIEDALDPETGKLIGDTLSGTPLKQLSTLLDRWLGRLDTGVAIFLNRQKFASTPTQAPWPGVTVVFRMSDIRVWRDIHTDLIQHLKKDLAIESARLDQPRVDVEVMHYTFRNNIYAEVTSPCFARFGELIVFSTSSDFVARMVDIYLGQGRYGLARSKEVDRLFEGTRTLDLNGSLFAFLDIRRILRWVDDMAPSWARAASLRQQLDNAEAKRKSLEFQARSLRHLKTEPARQEWVATRMEQWYEELNRALEDRVQRTVAPMVKNLGVVHTLGLTLGPAESSEDDAGTERLRLRTTFHFAP